MENIYLLIDRKNIKYTLNNSKSNVINIISDRLIRNIQENKDEITLELSTNLKLDDITYILYPVYKGEYALYKVIERESSRNTVKILGYASYYVDLNNIIIPKGEFTGSCKKILSDLLKEKGYRLVGVEDNEESFTYSNQEPNTLLKIILDIAKQRELFFNCKVRVNEERNITYTIELYKNSIIYDDISINEDRIEDLRCVNNLENIVSSFYLVGKDGITIKEMSTEEVKAATKGKSFAVIGEFLYETNCARKYLNNEERFAIFSCDAETPAELLKQGMEELEKRAKPNKEYELTSDYLMTINSQIDIYGKSIRVSDKVSTTYLTVTIVGEEKSIIDPAQNKTILGDYVEQQMDRKENTDV